MSIRMTPKERKAAVLDAALITAEKVGFVQMRTCDIAAAAQCGHGTVTLYWGTMPQLRRAVMRAAIKQERLKIIATGLAIGDKDALKAAPELKKAAIASLG